MKTLIKKADGTPTKSKVRALQYLEKNGISKDCLIEENGQFFYDMPDNDEFPKMDCHVADAPRNDECSIVHCSVSWETPVFIKGEERTQLVIPGTDVKALIIGKHPAGQLRAKSAFEISIDDENFVMSVDLISRMFKVRG